MLSYLEARKLPGIWYQVDGGDGDPATFFYYLGLAARKAAPRNRKPLPLLTPEYLPDLPGFARRFFRQLYSLLPATATVVLDNYQEVDAGSIFHGVMQEALVELRDGINVIVISRTEPPAQYARALANNLIGQIGWDELRLTLEETTVLATTKQRLDQEAIRSLQEQSNGWAAGLVLMLERFKRTGAVNSISRSETMATVFNYFAGQVFDQASAETRNLLMRTAFLPRMTVKMAEEITGGADAGKALDSLFRRHLFIDRRVAGNVIYEYHALFREFLLSRARDSLQAEERLRLAASAALLLEQHGRAEEAIPLYVEAADPDAATRLILQQGASLLGHGRGQTLRDWIDALPKAHVDSTPALLYWFGASLIQTAPIEARRHLERAFDRFREANDAVGQALTAAGVVQTYYYEGVDFAPLGHWVPVLQQFLAGATVFPSAEAELRTYVGVLAATVYRQHLHPTLPAWIAKVIGMLPLDIDVNQKITAAFFVLTHFIFAGDFDQGQRLIALTDPLISEPGALALNKVLWLGRVGYHLLLHGSHESAQTYLDRGQQIAADNGLASAVPLLCWFQQHIALHSGDAKEAQRLAGRFMATMNPSRRLESTYLHSIEAGLALLRGDNQSALRHVSTAVDAADKTRFEFQRIGFRAVRAQVAAEFASVEEALQAARETRVLLEETPFAVLDWWLMLIEAYIAVRQENVPGCRAKLHDAFALARQTGYYLSPLPSMKMLPCLCAEALIAGIEVEYVKTFIRGFHVLPPSPDIENWPWPIKLYTLGRFAIVIDDAPLRSTGKAQRKPLDLLKALVALGGREVGSAILIETLWPDSEGDAGETALTSTLHRLRKLLGRDDAIVVSDGKLTLNPQLVWVDVWAFERLLGKSEDALKQVQGGGKTIDDKITEPVFRLYQGHFLDRDGEQPWMLGMREKLRSKFLRHLIALGRHWEAGDHWDKAAEVYQRGLELDNLAEELYRHLMITYQKRNQPAGAIEVYRRCRQMLSVVLGIKPSLETEALYQSLKDG